MIINTEEWMTLAEAARLLEVSPQRVQVMADEDGTLDVERPWPRVSLVSRTSVESRLRGERLTRIAPAEVRAYVLKHEGAKEVRDVRAPVLDDRCREFIEGARPRWSNQRKDLWALEMARRLARHRSRSAAARS